MEIPQGVASAAEKTYTYSVWAIPPDDVGTRLKKLMDGLRSEFGGPQFEPHVTVVGAISLTEQEASEKFKSACKGLRAYNATVDRVATGTFFYQCVYLLLHPTAEVVEAGAHCSGHFGYKNATRNLLALASGLCFLCSQLTGGLAYMLEDMTYQRRLTGKMCGKWFVWECSGSASLPIEPPCNFQW